MIKTGEIVTEEEIQSIADALDKNIFNKRNIDWEMIASVITYQLVKIEVCRQIETESL